MTDQDSDVAGAEVQEVVDVAIDDIESGGNDEEADDVNKKTCYTPILNQANQLYEEKIHPALLPVHDKIYPIYEERVVPAMNSVEHFFDENDEDPAVEESTDEDGKIVRKSGTLFKVSPACFGAAVLGFTVATLVTGPFVAIAAGAGAGYATTRHDKVGEYSSFYGKKTYNGLYRGYKHSRTAMTTIKGKFSRENHDNVAIEQSTSNTSLEAA